MYISDLISVVLHYVSSSSTLIKLKSEWLKPPIYKQLVKTKVRSCYLEVAEILLNSSLNL